MVWTIGVYGCYLLASMGLSNEEIKRYARHLILPEVGMAGQERLRGSSVLCVGAGGLGSPIALYLAAAGVGRLGIVDFDRVDESNLQRQVLHGTADAGRLKTESAREAILRLNPNVAVDLYTEPLTSSNALDVLRPYDVVVDGTDNFPTRYLTNDACVLLGKPNVYGSIFRFEGQASVFDPKRGAPCYRCLYPEPPPPGLVPSCAEGGVLGALPGIIGVIQATEILKLILGIGSPLLGRLLLYNALEMSFRELKLRQDPECPICGKNPTIHELIDYDQFCGFPSGSSSTANQRDSGAEDGMMLEVTVDDLEAALKDPQNGIRSLDVRNSEERDICLIDGVDWIPLDQLPDRASELNASQRTYIHCKSGVRSLKAVRLLRDLGFNNVWSVRGGILEWIEKKAPDLPVY